MSGREGLGRLLDVSVGFVNQVTNNAADVTGKRVSLKDAAGVTIVVFAGAGTAGDDLDLVVKQHTASSGGTTANLAKIDHYYVKAATTLAGTETWSEITQTEAATITDAGGAGTSAETQQIVAIEINADMLSDGYSYVSVDSTNGGASNDKTASALYLLRDLNVQRTPSNLAASLS
jgi:hypothetical protein